MYLGYDAKRAYHNGTGLGHYSRTLLRSLAEFYPQHEYYLFNPSPSSLFRLDSNHLHEVLPERFLDRLFRSAWRSSWVKKDLKKLKIDLYHGLSHEIPMGIDKTGIKSVVTIHDLIHERYPQQYKAIDVKIYSQKFRYACEYADKVIAVSEQTRRDIIDYYKIPAEKISVTYQSCSPAFGKTVSEQEKIAVKQKYSLPDRFFLYVGSVIERKNLLNVCKALFLLRNELKIQLVVIGKGRKYLQQVKDYILQNGIQQNVIFLSEEFSARSSRTFQSASDFPAIYQQATAMVYPSFFEGFGIPVLEALWSRLPVITSNTSSLPEVGGDAAYYVDPNNAEEIAEAMKRISTDKEMADQLKERSWVQAQKFSAEKCASLVMGVYNSIF